MAPNRKARTMRRDRCATARVTELVPDTICDGLRGLIGAINFDLLRAHRVHVATVSDRDTLAAMRLIWERLKIIVEPSSAIALAAVLAQRERFAGRRVGIVLSGGNVDLNGYFERFS
jgi:threonine dehydratase